MARGLHSTANFSAEIAPERKLEEGSVKLGTLRAAATERVHSKGGALDPFSLESRTNAILLQPHSRRLLLSPGE